MTSATKLGTPRRGPYPRPQVNPDEALPASSRPHRLNVVAPTVADVVGQIGGWLFDRAMEGWRIDVLVPEGDSLTPLRILGV